MSVVERIIKESILMQLRKLEKRYERSAARHSRSGDPDPFEARLASRVRDAVEALAAEDDARVLEKVNDWAVSKPAQAVDLLLRRADDRARW